MIPRWVWRAYLLLLVSALLAFTGSEFGGTIEGQFFPIRVHQRIEDVTRNQKLLCWAWVSDKLRMAPYLDLHVDLERPAVGDLSHPEVFARNSGVPWHRAGTLAVGQPAPPFCIQLPPDLKGDEPVVLHQTIRYRGLWGLWTVLVPLPDVESRP